MKNWKLVNRLDMGDVFTKTWENEESQRELTMKKLREGESYYTPGRGTFTPDKDFYESFIDGEVIFSGTDKEKIQKKTVDWMRKHPEGKLNNTIAR